MNVGQNVRTIYLETETRWIDRAACGGTDRFGDWFPERRRGRGDAYERARAVCNRCPVQTECLEFAIGTHTTAGMWGGMTPKERRAEVRRRKGGK